MFLLGVLGQYWHPAEREASATVVDPQSAVNWFLIAMTVGSATLTLHRGLRGMFPRAKSVSAGAPLFGLGVFVTKLAAAAKDRPDSFSNVHAYSQMADLSLDVDSAYRALFLALQLGAIAILVGRWSGLHRGRFSGKIGFTSAAILNMMRVWLTRTPLI